MTTEDKFKVIVGIIGIIIGIAWGLYYRRRARRWLNENIIILGFTLAW